MGRTFLWVVAALTLGTVLGAWGPRAELLEMRAERDQMAKDERSCKRGAAASGIAQLLGGGARERRPGPVDAPEDPSERNPPDGAPDVRVEDAASPEKDGEHPTDGLPTPDAMAEALDARVAQARAAFIEQADPDAEQLAAVDAAMEKMNAKIKAQVDAFVAAAADGHEPDRRELMDFGAEALDAVIEADDAVRDAIPADQRAEVDDEALDPFSYVDGSTLESLAILQDRAR